MKVSSEMAQKTPIWIVDTSTPGEWTSWKLEEVVTQGESRFQRYLIGRSASLGLSLFIDDVLQSCERDEFIYHECLVHPVANLSSRWESICILGGGEGATLREALRYPAAHHVVMVDIDEQVVEVCRTHLSAFHRGAFEDPRAEVLFEDAWDFLAANPERFDAVIMDITDPLPGSPAERLYGPEFLTLVCSSLREHGTFSSLAGDAGGDLRLFTNMIAVARSIFEDVKPYIVGVPSFCGPWGFLVAGKHQLPAMTAAQIDANIPPDVVRTLKYYDGITHQRLFSLPKHIRERL